MEDVFGLFAPRRKPRDLAREDDRVMTRSIHDLELERRQLEQEERRLVLQLKSASRKGAADEELVTIARDIVRTGAARRQLQSAQAQLNSVRLQVRTSHATASVGTAMERAGTSMHRMNQRAPAAQMRTTMRDFSRESRRLERAQEQYSSCITDAVGTEGEEEEQHRLIQQVLDQHNVELSRQLVDAPRRDLEADGVSPELLRDLAAMSRGAA